MPPDPSPLAARLDEEIRTRTDGSVATIRKLRRRWSAELKLRPADEIFAASLELFERFGHRWPAYELVLVHPGAFKLVGPQTIERIAGRLGSWADVDQFGALVAGPAWRAEQVEDGTVHAWATRSDRWWRRAALVATVPLNVRSQGGAGDVSRTLAVCELLVHDRDDMVTKAMSWALRELVVHNPSAVDSFLTAHADHLAARIKREVRNKLATGLKNPRSPSLSAGHLTGAPLVASQESTSRSRRSFTEVIPAAKPPNQSKTARRTSLN